MISKTLKTKLLKDLEPSKKEHDQLQTIVDLLIDSLNKVALDNSIEVSFIVGGSFGKKTYLKGDFDVDIFCQFPKSIDEKTMEKNLEQLISKIDNNYTIQKGSRNYIFFTYKTSKGKIDVELVPTKQFDKLDEATNSTDYSYLHISFMQDYINKNPELANEIRLTKALLKAKKWYGAESYIGGFSGHVVDLLLVEHKSLENLLESAKKWGKQTIIDPANHYVSTDKILEEIDVSKHSSLILVDSILPQRNAARALTKRVYGEFLVWLSTLSQLQEKDFIRIDYTKKEFISNQIKRSKTLGSYMICYDVSFLNVESCDIAGAKIKKIFENYNNYITNYDFKVLTSSLYILPDFTGAILCYHCEQRYLSKKKFIRGPPFYLPQAVKEVIKKTSYYEIRGDYLWYEVSREYCDLSSLLIYSLEEFCSFHSSNCFFVSSFSYQTNF